MQINDQYLMDCISGSKMKSYYKSAEVAFSSAKNQPQPKSNFNNTDMLDSKSINSNNVNDLVTHLDIGNLLQNERLNSKDNSPLNSAKR